MMERPRQAEYRQHPCDYIFNRARDNGESTHLYAGALTAAEEHLSYELKKRRRQAKSIEAARRTTLDGRRKSECRVIKHTNTDTRKSTLSKGKKTSLRNLVRCNCHRQDRTFKCEMTNAGTGANKWLVQKFVFC